MGTAPARRALIGAARVVAALLGGGTVPAQASVAATASATPRIQYVGDSAGTTFTFTVTNASTASESLGSVRITRAGTPWTITACPSAPAGWTAVVAATTCTFDSPAGATGNIAAGGHATFTVTATTATGAANATGHWPVRVDADDTYNGGTNSAAASAATAGALAIKLDVWEITSAVLQPSVATAGAVCPKANKTALQSAPMDVVICGRNHANTALTPQTANSSLAGTMFDVKGGFFSGPVAAQSTSNVVLGTWGVTITQDIRNGKTVIAGIGSSSTQTSPTKTLTGYVSDGWPMFQRDLAHDGYNGIDKSISVANVHSLVTKWVATTGMPIESSPVVAKGKVYVGSDDGKLYAFDAIDLSHRSGGPPAKCSPIFTATTNGMANTAPAVDGGTVTIATNNLELDAFSAFGAINCSGSPPSCTPIWKATSFVNDSSPMPYAGLMFIAASGGVYRAVGFSGTNQLQLRLPAGMQRVMDRRNPRHHSGHRRAGHQHDERRPVLRIERTPVRVLHRHGDGGATVARSAERAARLLAGARQRRSLYRGRERRALRLRRYRLGAARPAPTPLRHLRRSRRHPTVSTTGRTADAPSMTHRD
jgi:hypothetical protein